MEHKKELSAAERVALITILKTRFEQNKHRHEGLDWAEIQARLERQPEKLWSLNAMEATGGEPDVTGYDKMTDAYIFCDCVAESPKGRRSVCYDPEALASSSFTAILHFIEASRKPNGCKRKGSLLRFMS